MGPYLFSGLKVIDCATVIAAPAAAMMLADFGADVIKIEQPGSGDMLRMLSDIPTTPDAGNDWFWQLDGRNKRSLALDMKTAAGAEVMRRIAAPMVGCEALSPSFCSHGASFQFVRSAETRRPRLWPDVTDVVTAERAEAISMLQVSVGVELFSAVFVPGTRFFSCRHSALVYTCIEKSPNPIPGKNLT